ncbi:MAG: hypothetical protein IJS74_04095 [Clostridia bacterium]|nr:hypothetical protein [Clostridia bacterium]
MKRLKRDRVKRGRIVLSAILTIALSLLSLGFGGYLGYVTLNINYITIGTMTGEVGGLLVVSDFFIFFGVIGLGIAMKEIFIAHKNEEKFSAYKGALYSSIVFYLIIAIISVVGVVSSFVSFIPSNFTWAIVGLGTLSLVLSGGCFYLVFRELKDHKKNMRRLSGDNQFVNLDLSAGEIRKFSDMRETERLKADERNLGKSANRGRENDSNNSAYIKNCSGSEFDVNNSQQQGENLDLTLAKAVLELNKYHEGRSSKERILRADVGENGAGHGDLGMVDFEELAVNLMQLEELRKAGLINDQEYQTLKKRCIT